MDYDGFSIEEVVANFYDLQQQKKLDDKAFNDDKKQFYENMEGYFKKHCKGSNKARFTIGFDNENSTIANGGEYVVTEIRRRDVVFDIAKLKKKLGPKLFRKASKLKMTVVDPEGLIEYAKSVGMKKDELLSFVNIEREVDENELDRLSELGEVSGEDIDGCYKVIEGKPWYKVSFSPEEQD